MYCSSRCSHLDELLGHGVAGAFSVLVHKLFQVRCAILEYLRAGVSNSDPERAACKSWRNTDLVCLQATHQIEHRLVVLLDVLHAEQPVIEASHKHISESEVQYGLFWNSGSSRQTGAYFTMWLLSLSIFSSETSRSAVDGTPSSSI